MIHILLIVAVTAPAVIGVSVGGWFTVAYFRIPSTTW